VASLAVGASRRSVCSVRLKRKEMSDPIVTKRPWKVQEVNELKRLAGQLQPHAIATSSAGRGSVKQKAFWLKIPLKPRPMIATHLRPDNRNILRSRRTKAPRSTCSCGRHGLQCASCLWFVRNRAELPRATADTRRRAGRPLGFMKWCQQEWSEQ